MLNPEDSDSLSSDEALDESEVDRESSLLKQEEQSLEKRRNQVTTDLVNYFKSTNLEEFLSKVESELGSITYDATKIEEWTEPTKNPDYAASDFFESIIPAYPDNSSRLLDAAAAGNFVGVEAALKNSDTKIDDRRNKPGDPNYSCTALIIAASKGKIDIVDLLIRKGADITFKTALRKTAWQCAMDNKHYNVANYIIKHQEELQKKFIKNQILAQDKTILFKQALGIIGKQIKDKLNGNEELIRLLGELSQNNEFIESILYEFKDNEHLSQLAQAGKETLEELEKKINAQNRNVAALLTGEFKKIKAYYSSFLPKEKENPTATSSINPSQSMSHFSAGGNIKASQVYNDHRAPTNIFYQSAVTYGTHSPAYSLPPGSQNPSSPIAALTKKEVIKQWFESKKKVSYYFPRSNLSTFKGRAAEINSLHSLLCYGYDLDVITELERKPKRIYINATADGLNYEFFTREDNRNLKKSRLPWHELPNLPHDTQEILKLKVIFLPQILALIPEVKHIKTNSIIEPCVITDISGGGKTEFVVAYVHTEKNYQRYIFHWWVPQVNQDTALKDIYTELYPLYLKLLDSNENPQNNEYDPIKLKKMLSEFNDWILVFDGYESTNFPMDLIPTDHFEDNNNRHVLITSSDLSWTYENNFSLKAWDGVNEYAEGILRKKKVKYSSNDIEVFSNFCHQKLGNHAQTVVFAVSLIGQMVNIESLVSTWSSQDSRREKYFILFFEELIKKACFLDNVELKKEDLYELLRLLSLLSTSNIDPCFLKEWSKNVGMDISLLQQLLQSLTNRCIISNNDDSMYLIHSTVQDACFVSLQQLLPQKSDNSGSMVTTSTKIISSLSVKDSQLKEVTKFLENVHKTIYAGFNYNFSHPNKSYNTWNLIPHIEAYQIHLSQLLDKILGESIQNYKTRNPLGENLIKILLIRLYWLTQLALYFKCQFQSYKKALNYIDEALILISILHSHDEIISKILVQLHLKDITYHNLSNFEDLLNHLAFEINQESDPNNIAAMFGVKDEINDIKRKSPNDWYASVWSALYMPGLYKEAQQELNTIPMIANVSHEPSRMSIKLTLLLAMTDMALGEYDETRELINRSIEVIPKVYSDESGKQWDAHKYIFAKVTLDIIEGKYIEAEQSINILQEKIAKSELTLQAKEQFEINFNILRLKAQLYLNQARYADCGTLYNELNKFDKMSVLAQMYLLDRIRFQIETGDISKIESDLNSLNAIVSQKNQDRHPMNAFPFIANGLIQMNKLNFKDAIEQFTKAMKCREKSFGIYDNRRHPETLELYLLLTEANIACNILSEASKYHKLATQLIDRFKQMSNIKYHIFFLKNMNFEIELASKTDNSHVDLIFTIDYYNSFLNYAKENNISDKHPIIIKSKKLIESLQASADFSKSSQLSKERISASDKQKFSVPISAASGLNTLFKKMGISENILITTDEQLKFARHEVPGDGECGYTAFGITRKDAYDFIKNRLNEIRDLLLPVVKEAVLTEKFINYIKEKGTANAALLAEYAKYKAAAEQGGNMNDSIIDNLYQKIDLIVIQSYIDYDIKDMKVDAGWSHPRILQVLAYLQKIKLYIWQLNDGKLIPHRQEEYAVYTPPTIESRTDLLFINNNHFDRLELQSDPAPTYSQINKPEVIKP